MFNDLTVVTPTRSVSDGPHTVSPAMRGTIIDTWPGGAEVEFVLDDGHTVFSVRANDDAWTPVGDIARLDGEPARRTATG